ncbi:hypothetical protein [Halobellus inordinatus]|uniref:hypothetical protein n=1 Tax=Halobellus inordinatus TaxID=1126236 RepID=UPI00210AF650|nr:hypothetical protein [Halobellus inordinatus]
MTRMQRRLSIVLIALLVIFTPALILVATLEALFLLGEITLADISALEFIELYLLDLALLVLFVVAVYQITRYVVGEQLPAPLTETETEERPADDESSD